MEQHETTVEHQTEPRRPLPSFVFIDLREDPEAWAQIEMDLPEGERVTAH